jgi:hypothetical protein
MLRHRFAVAIVASLLLSCGGTTTRHLVALGDEVRVSVTAPAPAESWSAIGFRDDGWRRQAIAFVEPLDAGLMPADVAVRRVFDVGGDAALFRTLTLTFDPGAPFDVYLNGERVGHGDAGASPLLLTPAPGLLRPSGNVLGLAVHAVEPASLSIAPTLDGDPEPAATGAAGALVVRGPWLVAPRPDGVTILWETDGPTPSTAVVDGKAFDGGAGTHHVAQVTGLLPAHAYAYHVEAAGQPTEPAELTTAPADTSARIRFVVYGDNRTNGDAHRRVVDAIRDEGADFLVNTGDLVNASTKVEWQTFFDIEYALLARTPIYPTLGNHEANSGGGNRFAELFPLGDPARFHGRVYSFDYGSVHVAVLDSNAWAGDQAPWLDEDLARAEAAGARHLFVVMHWGPFSGRHYLMHGSNMDALKYIVPVARKHHVDAMLAGHDHFYERGDDHGLQYFVTGGGGAPLAACGSIAATQVARSTYHYLVVDVVGDEAHVTAKDAGGTPFDEVDLTR